MLATLLEILILVLVSYEFYISMVGYKLSDLYPDGGLYR